MKLTDAQQALLDELLCRASAMRSHNHFSLALKKERPSILFGFKATKLRVAKALEYKGYLSRYPHNSSPKAEKLTYFRLTNLAYEKPCT